VDHAVVTRDEWLAARMPLLAKEKAHTRAGDALAAERRAMPWVKVETDYVFDRPSGKVTLSELFEGRRQLFTKNFMLAPGQAFQCTGCSLEVDHMAGLVEHLNGNGVSYAVVAPAPLPEIEAMKHRMGWTIPWVSSFGNDYIRDLVMAFAPDGVGGAGNQALYRDDDGQIYLTYAGYGRGGEMHMGIYGILDQMPLGRSENGPNFTMADWVKPRNLYGAGGAVAPNGEFHPESCGHI
jgi:predicted dithiol-disulfide oxidoreductase (DUF899 family)